MVSSFCDLVIATRSFAAVAADSALATVGIFWMDCDNGEALFCLTTTCLQLSLGFSLEIPTLLELGNTQPENIHMEVRANITFNFEEAFKKQFIIILCYVHIYKVSFGQVTYIDITKDG